MEDISEKIKALFSKALEWAEQQSTNILTNGRLLTPEEIEMAKRAGVSSPEKARILIVPSLPLPKDKELRETAISLGLLKPTMVGLTLGYGIYIVDGYQTRFIPHELRHVYQFEKAGSMSNFLSLYFEQLAKFGYENAPLEIDARQFEFI